LGGRGGLRRVIGLVEQSDVTMSAGFKPDSPAKISGR
jgi:hypothetical protein